METILLEERKSFLLELIEDLSLLLSTFSTDLALQTSEIRQKVLEEKFNLVVVGQFKRGKSTLINALLGEDILPTAVVPLTSIVTIIHYAPEEKITVHFIRGTEEIIPRGGLPDYITEKLNPQNAKKVESVEIELPSSFLKGGVQLVDTPGVGSIYSHNTDTSYRFLPKSDATIFLLTADQPLSISEVEFLRNVREHAAKVFFVLNKVDLLSENERKEAIAFIVDSLPKELPFPQEEIRLFPVSARTGLRGKVSKDETLYHQSKIDGLRNSLLDFLAKEKGNFMIKTASRRTRKIIAEASTLIRLRLKAYTESLESLREKIDKFQKFKEAVKKKQEDIGDLIYTAYKIVTMIEEDTVLFKDKSLPKVAKRFEEAASRSRHSNTAQLVQELNRAIIEIVTETVDEWRFEEEAKVKKKFDAGVEDLFGRMNSLIDDVYQHAAGLFNIEFQRMENYPLFTDETEFYYMILEDIKPSLEELSDAIVKRLPKIIAERLIYRKEKEQLMIEFDRQCGRVRYDFIQRIDKSMLRLGKVLTNTVNEHIEKIEKIMVDAMAMREKTSSEVSDMIAKYEEKLSKLADLESKFAELET